MPIEILWNWRQKPEIMSIFSFFKRRHAKPTPISSQVKERAVTLPVNQTVPQSSSSSSVSVSPNTEIKRQFYNEAGFQCYATFFKHWSGWITAGHCLTDAAHQWPDFVDDNNPHIWPGGLDAAMNGCRLPPWAPPHPKIGKTVLVKGFPAGSRFLEERKGVVYLERNKGSGIWIVHITAPDEPVVSGMSGGPVMDTETGQPIGILITRNSPADLNADRDPDESYDFVSLRAVWEAVRDIDAQDEPLDKPMV